MHTTWKHPSPNTIGKKKGVNCLFSFSFPMLPGSFGISSVVITLRLTNVIKAMMNL